MMRKQKLLRMILESWAIALAISVAPVHSAGSGGEQTNPEPDNGGGFCIDCHEHKD